VSLAPGPPLSDDVFPLEQDHLGELHKHSKRCVYSLFHSASIR
jgi:hypothetical protein